MSKLGFQPHIIDVFRRFHDTGSAESNETLACDPAGFAMLSEDDLDGAAYERPPMNWPGGDSPQGHYFALEGMAFDILQKSGFEREARSLRLRMRRAAPTYAELPSLLWRFVDFEPAAALPADKLAELRALADSMGLDADAIGRSRKRRVENPLAHDRERSTLAQEWTWLVEHADVVSPFGKTAACELAPRAMLLLAEKWLPQLGKPLALPATDESVGNLAWFRARFPAGWSHIDHLGESAVISAPRAEDFATQLTLAFFEMADKSSRGWSLEDARLFAFNHKNNVNINGSAVMGLGAHDHFASQVIPILVGSASGPARAAASGLGAHVRALNPNMERQHDALTLWAVYRAVDPFGARVIEEELTNPENNKTLGKDHGSAALAGLEKLVLECSGAALWPSDDHSGPLAPPNLKKRVRAL